MPGTSFAENFKGQDGMLTPHHIKTQHDHFPNFYKTKKPFVPSIQIASTTKPRHKKPTKVYKKHKGRPTLAPLVNLLTTLNPFKGHRRPGASKPPSVKKVTAKPSFLGTPLPKIKPMLDDIEHGYKQFINQGGKFFNGLFGSNSQQVQRRQGYTTLIEDKAAKPSRLSVGGQKELSRLERIKLLLKEAREQPLL